MQLEITSNGIKYSSEIASIDGAAFILFPEKHHTQEEVKKAKREIRFNQDVVSLHVASEYDWDDLYKTQIFAQPETRKLKWYEIEQDEKLLRQERKKGTTPEQFVKNIVLPNVDKVRERNFQKFGEERCKGI